MSAVMNVATRFRQAIVYPPSDWQAPLDQLLDQLSRAYHQAAGWPRQFDFPDNWWTSFRALEQRLTGPGGFRERNDMVGYRASCEMFRRQTVEWIGKQRDRIIQQQVDQQFPPAYSLTDSLSRTKKG